MKLCQVQARADRTGGKQESCGEPAEFKLKYKAFGPYPAHTSYMCTLHAEMATKLRRKVD